MSPQSGMPDENPDEVRARGQGILTWILLVGTLLAFLAGPSMVVLFFGLLPTLVAYIIDRSKGKSNTFCVASMNLIGVFPYIIELWSGDNTFAMALSISTDLFAMVVMYSSAAFGWVVFMGLPPLISTFIIIMQQRKVAQMRGIQKDLIEEWGSEVASLVQKQSTSDRDEHFENALG